MPVAPAKSTIANDMSFRLWGTIRDISEMVIITAVIVVFVRTIAATYTVSGPSMEPTLIQDDRVFVNEFGALRFANISLYGDAGFLFQGPERGDIVVFEHPTELSSEKVVKRILAIPGDTVDIVNGDVYVNDVKTEYSDDFTTIRSHFEYPITVPHASYFVMGDNRGSSNDSRYFGYVSADVLVGKVWAIYWPLNDFAVF